MDSYNKLNAIAFKLFTEMTEEETGKPKSAMPEKRAMTFVKEMKGQFKAGEEVDVVKEGSNYNVFKKNVMGGAHPVKLNEKQAEEFFGHKLNEAFADTLKSAGKWAAEKAGQAAGAVAKGAVAAGKSALTQAANQFYGNTPEARIMDQAVSILLPSFKKSFDLFEPLKGKFSDEQIKKFVKDKVLVPTISRQTSASPAAPAKSEASAAPAKPAAIPTPKATTGNTAKTISDIKKIPIDALRSELERRAKEDEVKRAEDSAQKKVAEEKEEMDEDAKAKLPKGVPQAKFVDKNAAKPKKAKEIGAFRGGKAGSGSKAPKE